MASKKSTALVLAAEPPEPESPQLKSWALVELFGHQRIVGYVPEQPFGSGVLFRVDSEGMAVRFGYLPPKF